MNNKILLGFLDIPALQLFSQDLTKELKLAQLLDLKTDNFLSKMSSKVATIGSAWKLKMSKILKTMQEWVDQYKNDDPPRRVGQDAAIAAMDIMLQSWQHGLDQESIKAAGCEVHRMLEILHAFHGRLSIEEAIGQEQ